MNQAIQPCREMRTRCCIVGGGPAGMMLGYLLGRAGVDTLVLEKHADFLRDFRGDTVHPSTMEIMQELGLLDDFLMRPHSRIRQIGGEFGQDFLWLADFARLKTPAPFIAMMPQWHFLDFLAQQAQAFATLQILREHNVVDLLADAGRVNGVCVQTPAGPLEIAADLVIGCDGRHSVVRERAGLSVEDIGAPIDVLWFRMTKSNEMLQPAFLHAETDGFLITIDRGDYWQCAFVIQKGEMAGLKQDGLEAFRGRIVAMVPALHAHIGDVASWDDVKLLTVTIDRLTRWAKPGLLCIGDSAHAMSPVGGVGINLAIQDAVATANALASVLRSGPVPLTTLDTIQQRREWPMKVVQVIQVAVQNRIIKPALGGKVTPPVLMRLFDAIPWLRQFPAPLVGLGIRREHVRSPKA